MAKKNDKDKPADYDDLFARLHKVVTKLDKKFSDEDRETQIFDLSLTIGKSFLKDVRRIADALEKKKK